MGRAFLGGLAASSGQLREGFVAADPGSLRSLWSPGEKKIAQLEMSMVLFALVSRPDSFRSRHGVWYIDNSAAVPYPRSIG